MSVNVIDRSGRSLTVNACIPRPTGAAGDAWDAAVLHCHPAAPTVAYRGPAAYTDPTTPYSPTPVSPALKWGGMDSTEFAAHVAERNAEAAERVAAALAEFTRKRALGAFGSLQVFERPAGTDVAFVMIPGESRPLTFDAANYPTGNLYNYVAPVPPSLVAGFSSSSPDAVLWGVHEPLPRYSGGPSVGSVVAGYTSGEVFDTHTMPGGGTAGRPHMFTTNAEPGPVQGYVTTYRESAGPRAELGADGVWRRHGVFALDAPDVMALPFVTTSPGSGVQVLAPTPGDPPSGRGGGLDAGAVWQVFTTA